MRSIVSRLLLLGSLWTGRSTGQSSVSSHPDLGSSTQDESSGNVTTSLGDSEHFFCGRPSTYSSPLMSECMIALYSFPTSYEQQTFTPQNLPRSFRNGKCEVLVEIAYGETDQSSWLQLHLAAIKLALGCEGSESSGRSEWLKPRTIGAVKGLGRGREIGIRIGKAGKMPGYQRLGSGNETLTQDSGTVEI